MGHAPRQFERRPAVTISPQLQTNVELAEGYELKAYKDDEGYWTIGYGHLLDQSVDWTGHEITPETASALLAQDLAGAQAQAARLPEWPSLDTQCRQDAVTEAVFNLGVEHWVKEFPKTRASIEAQQWAQAAANLRASPEWVKEVGLARVTRLAGYLQSGSYFPLAASS